jgi:hypothetical protein
MRIRALRRVRVVHWWSLGNLHIKAHRQRFRRITGFIVAGLVFEGTADHILAGLRRVQRAYQHINIEISGVNVKFFVGIEGKAHVLAFGISDFADHHVGIGFYLEHGRNQELRFRHVGIDVVSAGNAKRERRRAWLALHHGHNRSGHNFHGQTFGSKVVVLRQSSNRSQAHEQKKHTEKNLHRSQTTPSCRALRSYQISHQASPHPSHLRSHLRA